MACDDAINWKLAIKRRSLQRHQSGWARKQLHLGLSFSWCQDHGQLLFYSIGWNTDFYVNAVQNIMNDPSIRSHTHTAASTKTCQGYVNKYTVSGINHSCPDWLNLRPLHPCFTSSRKQTPALFVYPLTHCECTRLELGTPRPLPMQRFKTPQAAGQTFDQS